MAEFLGTPAGLGSRIRRRRTELGLSQRELASRSGVVHTHISRIELDRTGVSVAVLQRISAVLQTSIEWLVDHQDGATRTSGQGGTLNVSPQEVSLLGLFRSLAPPDRDYIHRLLLLLGGNTAGTSAEVQRRPRRVTLWQSLGKTSREPAQPDSAVVGKGCAVFVARDDSMAGAGIEPASLIAVRNVPPKKGDIVLVEIDHAEILIRYYYPRPQQRVEFKADKGVKALLVDQESIQILGVVTHVRREVSRRGVDR